MPHSIRRTLGHTLAALSVAALAACASPGDSQTHVSPIATAPLGVQAPAPQEQAARSGDWWLALHDDALTRLIDRALADGPTLQAVTARLEAARAQAMAAGAGTGPRVDLTADATRQHFTANSIYPPPLGGAMYTQGDLVLNGSWELDLFGRMHSRLKAAIGNERAARADSEAARLLLTTQVARQYVHLAQLLAQRDVARRALAQRQEIFDLVRQRVKAGIDTNVEFYEGQGALPEIRQQIDGLDEQITLSRHMLAMLTGQAPNSLDALTPALSAQVWFKLPEHVPADLLARRADVQAAVWRVEAAHHQVAAAKADFYPNIDLMAFAGYSSLGFEHLLQSASRESGWGPAIHLPLFDSGLLRARLRGSTADLDAAVAAYNRSVLEALREAADGIASLQSIAQQQAEQDSAQDSAQRAYDLAVQRYRAGLGGYLNVLHAESTILAQRRLHADLQARLQDSSIALVNALGGWPQDLAAAPAPAPVATPVAALSHPHP